MVELKVQSKPCQIFNTVISFPPLARRVHITESTLKHLNKAYDVEEGNGHLRDLYLKELNVKTYLVIDPRVSSLLSTLKMCIVELSMLSLMIYYRFCFCFTEP